jgi:membrane protein
MPVRPALVRLRWTAIDYAKRVWDNSGEDNVFFLAGGIAFNLILAAVPFFLLLVSGLGWFLGESADRSSASVVAMIDQLLPRQSDALRGPTLRVLDDIVRARGTIGLYSAIGFVWFSTRFFGSLRAVLAEVFDIEHERGIIAGKLFDIKITIISSVLIVAYIAVSTYLAVYTNEGVQVLGRMGVEAEAIGQLQYWLGRSVAFAVIVLMFFSLYKFLPVRGVPWKAALISAAFTGVMFEFAKDLFARIVGTFSAGSIYTGTIAALVLVVFWVYYSALIFILGGEVGQVYELRRVRRMQREVLYDR